MKKTFTNPILSGFYPDPSICRVGEDYYMVTSSFTYFPGLPIFHSKDLVHWQQIGHGIDRPEQLDYKDCETSLGLWAPTIRYHDGMFYIINTFVSGGREVYRDNFIITAKNPAGPWSDPIFIEGADGIDPSLFFDDDGSIWYTGNFICKDAQYEGHHGIYLVSLDQNTFQMRGERKVIWDGAQTMAKWVEAPHIYKKDGLYYLIVAEGGTFTNHCVMMARCDTIDGEYEFCPRNPIVSHRHLPLTSEISVTGHADIVETQNGEWWMVLLGIRPYEGFHFNLGRETFLLPVTWAEDGWLMVDNDTGLVNKEERFPDLPRQFFFAQDQSDNFESKSLGLIWNTIHPPKQEFYSLSVRPGYLRIKCLPEKLENITTPATVLRRQQHHYFLAKLSMEFRPVSKNEQAGLIAIQDNRYHYKFIKTQKDHQEVLQLWKVENKEKIQIKEVFLSFNTTLYLAIQGNCDTYDFYFGDSEQNLSLFAGGLDASLLSSNTNQGFTGAYIGMYASAEGSFSENYADFDWFHYTSL